MQEVADAAAFRQRVAVVMKQKAEVMEDLRTGHEQPGGRLRALHQRHYPPEDYISDVELMVWNALRQGASVRRGCRAPCSIIGTYRA